MWQGHLREEIIMWVGHSELEALSLSGDDVVSSSVFILCVYFVRILVKTGCIKIRLDLIFIDGEIQL